MVSLHRPSHLSWFATIALGLLGLGLWSGFRPQPPASIPTVQRSSPVTPLVMSGGNPHVRALMRTISASEAAGDSPYTVIYGGTHVNDLSRHPERCIPIMAGPNVGNCSTAAGRYQFINTTWAEKARAYHPRPSGAWWQRQYSFEPQYQDQVVHAWLSDRRAWGMDIPAQLKAGKLQTVLKRLSGTWTSLGYGIEDNVVTPKLGSIYQLVLAEELDSDRSPANQWLTEALPSTRPMMALSRDNARLE